MASINIDICNNESLSNINDGNANVSIWALLESRFFNKDTEIVLLHVSEI